MLVDPDKSKFILTRPPRFGKTVFCEMLGAYVDCKTTPDMFNTLFGGTEVESLQDCPIYRSRLEVFRGKCAYLSLVSQHALADAVFSGPS